MFAARFGGGPEILRLWHQQQYANREGEEPRPELLVYPLNLRIVKEALQTKPSALITVSRDVRHHHVMMWCISQCSWSHKHQSTMTCPKPGNCIDCEPIASRFSNGRLRLAKS